jgi:hypothetical protein
MNAGRLAQPTDTAPPTIHPTLKVGWPIRRRQIGEAMIGVRDSSGGVF